MGWVNRRRDHGDLIFLDLRDRSGITQIVLDKSLSGPAHTRAEAVRPEYVIAIQGKVRRRDAGLENPKMPTGEIEVFATELLILNDARTPPFSPAEDAIANEEVRLKYRYLDLRREQMQHNFALRSRVAMAIRNNLVQAGFLEIETPFMTRSTPEGARDYLVPSRVHPGRVLRPAPVSADLQTDTHGLRLRQVLPNCTLLPRRRPPRRPSTRVHPD